MPLQNFVEVVVKLRSVKFVITLKSLEKIVITLRSCTHLMFVYANHLQYAYDTYLGWMACLSRTLLKL